MSRRPGGDRGAAVVEFVFVAVAVMVPLVYFVVAAAVVQRTQLAVAQAAREAGRAVATSDAGADLQLRVATAVRLALASHGVPDDATVRIVAAGQPCSSAPVPVSVRPSAEFTVCVTRPVPLPAVPAVLGGRAVTCVGRFTVRVDDFRAAL